VGGEQWEGKRVKVRQNIKAIEIHWLLLGLGTRQLKGSGSAPQIAWNERVRDNGMLRTGFDDQSSLLPRLQATVEVGNPGVTKRLHGGYGQGGAAP
jgi:hypothetical protein